MSGSANHSAANVPCAAKPARSCSASARCTCDRSCRPPEIGHETGPAAASPARLGRCRDAGGHQLQLHPVDQARAVESRASDGFVAQIPLSLVKAGAAGGAVPWIAIEPPGQPWPNLPGKTQGAGPFYLVWEHPERSGVASEQWPYQLASLEVVESPAHRWPQLAVDPSLAPNAPARRGEVVFVANCLPCHRLNGGGAGEMGPDLGAPMNVTEYLTEGGLRAIVRDPRSVRTWPLQQMPGFNREALPDSDLDAVIAYLRPSARATSNAGR